MRSKFMFPIPSKPKGKSVEMEINKTTNTNRKIQINYETDTPPQVLVVDDDPIFGKIIKKIAQDVDVDLVVCETINDFARLKSYDFDVVIMDYDLGAVTGFELTSYLEKFTKEVIPVILVSQTDQNNSHEWPITITKFVHKRQGPFAVFSAALEVHKDSK